MHLRADGQDTRAANDDLTTAVMAADAYVDRDGARVARADPLQEPT